MSVAGCATPPHVELNAPSASAPVEERLRALDDLQATSSHETHTTYLRNGVPVGSSRTTDYLQLKGGERVYHAEDLLPVVKEGSAAAGAAERSAEAASTADTLQGWGWGVTLLGCGIMGSSFLFVEDGQPDEYGLSTPDYSGMWTAMAVGGVVALGGVVVNLVGGSHRREANDEKATAFELYNKALAERLDICADGKALVPCAERGRARSSAPSEAAGDGGLELGD